MLTALRCWWLSLREEALSASIANGTCLVQERTAELEYAHKRLNTLIEKRRQVRVRRAQIDKPARLISHNSRGIV